MTNQDELYALRNARRLLGPDWNRRILAANLLGEAHAVEAVADLEAVAIENKHPELLKAAVRALGKIHDEMAVAALGHVLENIQEELPAIHCLDLLLLAHENGSQAAVLALASQSGRLFPDLLNRAWHGETAASQVILQMGEPGINQLIKSLQIPSRHDIAARLLVESGEAAEKPLMQALDQANQADRPAILDILLRIGGKARENILEKYARN